MSDATKTVAARLRDEDLLRKARVHPIAILSALLTYKAGRGMRGKHTWSPVAKVVDALDAAFYLTFQNVEPSRKRTLLALDVSGSMTGGCVGGVVGLSPRIASAAMALITAATEPDHQFVAFTGGVWGDKKQDALRALSELDISPRQRLDDVVRKVSNLPFGGTDCSLPMLWAEAKKVEIDTFVIYTDSETWAGAMHPSQALRQYRHKMGIPAKLVVVGMVSNGFTIADPNDAGMLDVVGFDTASPSLISDFARS
jgi:60 kDa SS-A/Ro ribonucleoprotein